MDPLIYIKDIHTGNWHFQPRFAVDVPGPQEGWTQPAEHPQSMSCFGFGELSLYLSNNP